MKRPAISTAALLVLLASAPGAVPPSTTRTYQGTIQGLDPRAGSLSPTCGVEMALRIVQVRITPASLGPVKGEGPAAAPWKRGHSEALRPRAIGTRARSRIRPESGR